MSTVGNLQALAQLTGRPYLELRNSIGWTGVNLAALARDAGGDEDWSIAMAAAIIAGWRDNRDLYLRIAAEIDGINAAGYASRQTGLFGLWESYEMRAHHEFGPSVLPLAWEGAFKFFEIAPPWKTGIYLAMVSGLPDERSVAPIGWLIERTKDRIVRDRAALALSKLPREQAAARIEDLKETSNALKDAADTARDFLD